MQRRRQAGIAQGLWNEDAVAYLLPGHSEPSEVQARLHVLGLQQRELVQHRVRRVAGGEHYTTPADHETAA